MNLICKKCNKSVPVTADYCTDCSAPLWVFPAGDSVASGRSNGSSSMTKLFTCPHCHNTAEYERTTGNIWVAISKKDHSGAVAGAVSAGLMGLFGLPVALAFLGAALASKSGTATCPICNTQTRVEEC